MTSAALSVTKLRVHRPHRTAPLLARAVAFVLWAALVPLFFTAGASSAEAAGDASVTPIVDRFDATVRLFWATGSGPAPPAATPVPLTLAPPGPLTPAPAFFVVGEDAADGGSGGSDAARRSAALVAALAVDVAQAAGADVADVAVFPLAADAARVRVFAARPGGPSPVAVGAALAAAAAAGTLPLRSRAVYAAMAPFADAVRSADDGEVRGDGVDVDATDNGDPPPLAAGAVSEGPVAVRTVHASVTPLPLGVAAVVGFDVSDARGAVSRPAWSALDFYAPAVAAAVAADVAAAIASPILAGPAGALAVAALPIAASDVSFVRAVAVRARGARRVRVDVSVEALTVAELRARLWRLDAAAPRRPLPRTTAALQFLALATPGRPLGSAPAAVDAVFDGADARPVAAGSGAAGGCGAACAVPSALCVGAAVATVLAVAVAFGGPVGSAFAASEDAAGGGVPALAAAEGGWDGWSGAAAAALARSANRAPTAAATAAVATMAPSPSMQPQEQQPEPQPQQARQQEQPQQKEAQEARAVLSASPAPMSPAATATSDTAQRHSGRRERSAHRSVHTPSQPTAPANSAFDAPASDSSVAVPTPAARSAFNARAGVWSAAAALQTPPPLAAPATAAEVALPRAPSPFPRGAVAGPSANRRTSPAAAALASSPPLPPPDARATDAALRPSAARPLPPTAATGFGFVRGPAAQERRAAVDSWLGPVRATADEPPPPALAVASAAASASAPPPAPWCGSSAARLSRVALPFETYDAAPVPGADGLPWPTERWLARGGAVAEGGGTAGLAPPVMAGTRLRGLAPPALD